MQHSEIRTLHTGKIEINQISKKARVVESSVKNIAELVLKSSNARWKEIIFVFVDNPFIRKINREFLKRDEPTDVISFNYSESDGENSGLLEGEVYISLEQAAVNAKHYRESYESEVRRLIIHAILHLLGYTDYEPSKQKFMRESENFFLKKAQNLPGVIEGETPRS